MSCLLTQAWTPATLNRYERSKYLRIGKKREKMKTGMKIILSLKEFIALIVVCFFFSIIWRTVNIFSFDIFLTCVKIFNAINSLLIAEKQLTATEKTLYLQSLVTMLTSLHIYRRHHCKELLWGRSCSPESKGKGLSSAYTGVIVSAKTFLLALISVSDQAVYFGRRWIICFI